MRTCFSMQSKWQESKCNLYLACDIDMSERLTKCHECQYFHEENNVELLSANLDHVHMVGGSHKYHLQCVELF